VRAQHLLVRALADPRRADITGTALGIVAGLVLLVLPIIMMGLAYFLNKRRERRQAEVSPTYAWAEGPMDDVRRVVISNRVLC
jgi:hypothetical protein